VQSDIEGLAVNIENVDADARLHIHLQPVGEGLQVEAFVQPFTDAGPIYKPGTGGTIFLYARKNAPDLNLLHGSL
jgi:hypothetical protein